MRAELGRPAGAGPPPARPPFVAGLQQVVVHELVEVIGGQGAADPHGTGGLVARDRDAPLADVTVEGTPHRVRESGEAGELLLEVGRVHGLILKQITA